MFFVGTYDLIIDAKNRFTIPRVVELQMMNRAEDGEAFYLAPGKRPGTLSLHPKLALEKLTRHAVATDELDEEAQVQRLFEFSQMALVKPDDQGRVVLPKPLMERAGLKPGEVTLVGAKDHLQVWLRSDFEAFAAERWAKRGA